VKVSSSNRPVHICFPIRAGKVGLLSSESPPFRSGGVDPCPLSQVYIGAVEPAAGKSTPR
jgi:hypothetical protein